MPILPIASSRVSEPLKNTRLLFQLNADQIAIQRKFDELSTGKRVSRISDDPAAAGRAIILQRGISQVEQLSRNAGVAESFYTATDDSLKRLGDALIEARGATVEAAQNVLSDDERHAIALTIRSSLESAVAAGNSIFRDQQLLGGTLENSAPLEYVGADVLFKGTDAIARTSVGGGGLVNVGINGNDALALANRFFEGKSLQAGLDRSTPLRDLRGGEGVRPGVIRVSDSGNFVDVDLRSISTLGDIVDVLESIELNERSLSVTIQTDGITIAYADGQPGTLAIEDSAGDFLASDLSIRNPLGNSPPPLVAIGLAPRVTEATSISRLNNGLGLDLSSGIRIQQGSQSFTVDLSASNTVSDVLIAINRSGADVRAELDTKSGGVVLRSLRSGVDYSVGENGGTAATALGLRTATAETRLSELNHGRGISLNAPGPDFSIIRPDGVQLDLNLEGANTINDVMDLIRTHPLNLDTLRVIPSLNPIGNGIQLLGPPGINEITVIAGTTGNAAEVLGLVGKGQTQAVGAQSGPFALFNGADYLSREAGGTVDTLLRLEAAIREGDIPEIGRLQQRLDIDLDQATRMRGRVGVWSQNVEALKDTADNQAISLKSELSVEIDADLATVISELQQRQTSLEASLRLIGQSAQLSLLDFL